MARTTTTDATMSVAAIPANSAVTKATLEALTYAEVTLATDLPDIFPTKTNISTPTLKETLLDPGPPTASTQSTVIQWNGNGADADPTHLLMIKTFLDSINPDLDVLGTMAFQFDYLTGKLYTFEASLDHVGHNATSAAILGMPLTFSVRSQIWESDKPTS